MEFEVAVSGCGFEFKILKNAWFSLFNSPYPAHKSESAIDIYYPEEEALMPLDEGKVLETRWFETSKIRSDALEKEPLILVKVDEKIVVKILHVNPTVKVGEKVRLGDPLGKLIISGYFLPWTDKHAHFELRSIHDPYRACGAYKLKVNLNFKKPISFSQNQKWEFRVREVLKRFVWAEPTTNNMNLVSGLTVLVGNKAYPVDGGIPYHGYGVVVGGKGRMVKDPMGNVIGKRTGETHAGMMFKVLGKPLVNGKKIVGVGSFMKNRLLKIVGIKEKLKEGDILKLRFK